LFVKQKRNNNALFFILKNADRPFFACDAERTVRRPNLDWRPQRDTHQYDAFDGIGRVKH